MSSYEYDGRPKAVKEAEDNLVCSLRSNPVLYRLANKILFRLIQLAKAAKITNREILYFIKQQNFNEEQAKKNSTRRRTSLKIRKYTFRIKGDAIIKNGYNCGRYNCNNILKCATEDELLAFNIKNGIKLLQITGAYYIFQRNPKIITYCIEHNPHLQYRVLKTFRGLFHVPDSFNFEQLTKIVKKSGGHWFFPWLLMYGVSPVQSLFHRNLAMDPDYVRKRMNNISKLSNVVLNSTEGCISEQFDSNIKNIVKGTTFYRPTFNGVWWNIMKQYKKHVVAGPSGSSVVFYDIIFNVTGILKKNFKNHVNALALLIADYYPAYHSIAEILQLYTEDAKLPKYSLEMNDIEYLRRIGIK